MNANENPFTDRYFSAAVQQAFSRLSGDFNPMHVDPIYARRTIAGGQVVHGIHQALFAFETALTHHRHENTSPQSITGFTALFQKPVLVGETVRFHLKEDSSEKSQMTGTIQNESVCQISMQWGTIGKLWQTEPAPLKSEPVTELGFDDLTGKTGTVELGLDTALARKMFPRTTTTLGPQRIAEVLALSRLVGMHCPGLHSLFSQCAMTFRDASESSSLNYRVQEVDDRFGKIIMHVSGPCLEGTVTAFFRPPPEQQPGMSEVARLVQPGSFTQSVALIVGGSRGLGEITARLIAAGGGLPIITYYQGAADAQRIADEIRSWGGRCEVRQFDIRHGETFMQELAAEKLAPRSLYYFATPKIFGRKRGFFDYELLRDFMDVYVTAFGKLVDRAAENCAPPLRVFYPSSIAVTETMREMTEYAMAKKAGEALCSFYNRHAKNIEIIVERLPRIRTDQTSTLMPIPAENALDVMLPLARRVEARCMGPAGFEPATKAL